MSKAKTFRCTVPYLVMPKYRNKIIGICDRLDIRAERTGWLDGEMEFTLSGTRKDLWMFFKGTGCWTRKEVFDNLVETA